MAYLKEIKYLSNLSNAFFLVAVQSHELEDCYVFVILDPQ